MLLSWKDMQHKKITENGQIQLDVASAGRDELEKAIAENADWREVFGKDLYANIQEIRKAVTI